MAHPDRGCAETLALSFFFRRFRSRPTGRRQGARGAVPVRWDAIAAPDASDKNHDFLNA
jgi:hypothetical protein